MFGIKKKLVKKANKIARKGGGASPQNKILIKYVLNYLEENDMTPEEFEKELKEGKGKAIIKVLTKGKSIDAFLNGLFVEIKKEYYKKQK